jgi:hypothetical protein
MGVASAVLQHSDPRSREENYNKGAIVEAARSLQSIVIAFDN